MNRTEAEQAARLLWGSAGAVERRQDRNRALRFVVGVNVEHPDLGLLFEVRGAGGSFREAFTDAAAHPEQPRQVVPRLGVLLEQAKAQAMADLTREQVVRAARGSKSGRLMDLLLPHQREGWLALQERLRKKTPTPRNFR